jgi:putative ABC transport system permease protein
LLRRLFRKMVNNKRLIGCLLIGLILAAAMISSIPIYTDGVLQRMLTKDLENYQRTTGRYPGTYYYDEKLYNMSKSQVADRINKLDEIFNKKFYPQLGLPYHEFNWRVTNDYLSSLPEREEEGRKTRSVRVEAYSNLEEHIKILHGRMPSDKKVGDTYEVMVTEAAVHNMDILLDKVFLVRDVLREDRKYIKIKVVGVFTIKDPQDPYWMEGSWQMPESFIMNYELFNSEYMEEEITSITNVRWFYALDYHKIKVSNLGRLVSVLDYQIEVLRAGFGDLMPAVSILERYVERSKLLKTTLWVIQIPVLFMITFYLFMVSQLIIEQEKNEIAVLKSRGASRGHIVKDYLIQSLILCGIALAAGPPAGLLLCRVIGASNGFLQFVNRTRLPIHLNLRAYIYVIIGLIFFILTMIIPAIRATGTTIVVHKQKNARKLSTNLWKKYFIDVLLMAVSLYGLYTYKNRQDILKLTGAKGSELPIDPLLFLISTLFIIALGMMFLRIFPYMVMVIFKLGRKVWGPVTYSSMINASRSGGRDGFIILFLVLTISVGIFNANAARTINTNEEEKVKYALGADLVLRTRWENDGQASPAMGPPYGNMGQGDSGMSRPVTYREPPFIPYTQLRGVESVTKVFVKRNALTTVGKKTAGNTYVMGIESHEFGKTAWFRNSLLPHHIYDYLNVLAADPTAFLVSTSFKEKYDAKLGDIIYVKWGENDFLQGVIYAFVDYWPSFNPHFKGNTSQTQDLIVANLAYIQAKMRMEPYEIWMKTDPEVTSKEIYEEIEEKKLGVLEIKDSKQMVIQRKNDPMLQGTNGALTMGFIVTMIVCTLGFLIYWILSIEKRTLQFGILRAMGLTIRKVIGIIACEQIIISGTAIIVGILAGGITSDLFIPLLQIVYGSAEQVPPFKVMAYRGDYIKLYMIILAMLLLGFAVLGRLIASIRINQAIKLGED